MISTIEFAEMTAMLLDYCGSSSEGVRYLRFVGDEPIVNAIWARLSSKEARDKAWSSGVSIPVPGRSYPEPIALNKGWVYKTRRARLPSGLVDLAVIHPFLTLSEDNERGFYILTYETDGPPTGFFERLNRSLAIPLKPEWTPFLWELGQQAQSRFVLETKTVSTEGEEKEETTLQETTDIPIAQLNALGEAAVYTVHTSGRYKEAWLQIIREHLQLGIQLSRAPGGGTRYGADPWTIDRKGNTWTLIHETDTQVEAESLNFLLAQAREELGVNLLVPGRAGG